MIIAIFQTMQGKVLTEIPQQLSGEMGSRIQVCQFVVRTGCNNHSSMSLGVLQHSLG